VPFGLGAQGLVVRLRYRSVCDRHAFIATRWLGQFSQA
jgi:hypothetical protein